MYKNLQLFDGFPKDSKELEEARKLVKFLEGEWSGMRVSGRGAVHRDITDERHIQKLNETVEHICEKWNKQIRR